MDAAQSASSHPETMEERCETFHDYYLIEVYTPLALTVTTLWWLSDFLSRYVLFTGYERPCQGGSSCAV